MADPTRPLLTCYLDPPPDPPGTTGTPAAATTPATPAGAEADRIDLTGTSWSTWVAKTVNLLLELGAVEPGTGAHVLLRLPPHWQTAVWTEAALRLGARVTLAGAAEPAEPAAVVAYDRAGEAVACGSDDAEERFFLPLLPMNAAGVLPPLSTRLGAWNHAAEVSAFGDRYDLPASVRALAAGTARVTSGGTGRASLVGGAVGPGRAVTLDGAGLVTAADARADAAGLAPGGRLLATGHAVGGSWLDLLAAARRGGSLVLAPDAATLDGDRAARRWAAERVTATAAGAPPEAGGRP